MKKRLAVILSLSLLGAAALPALAADAEPPMVTSPGYETSVSEEAADASGFPVEVDGEPLHAQAFVMVPLRALAEKLGFTVAWENGVVTVTGPERYAQLTIGEDEYFAAPTQEGMMGASLFSLGCAPYVSGGCTYVPVEFFDALLGCGEGTVALEENAVKIRTGSAAVQIPNPFTDHETLAEAAGAAGFALTVPETVNGAPRRSIQTMDGGMIQVFYGSEENETCIRKAPGSGDISGDHSVYVQVSTVDVNETGVTIKGENGLVHLAIWTRGGYTYSISAKAGMRISDLSALVQLVK